MSNFDTDADRALFTAITASLIRVNNKLEKVETVLDKHLETANAIKTIHAGMMDIFRTIAVFMTETPDLLNTVVNLALETKEGVSRINELNIQLVQKDINRKMAIRSTNFGIFSVAQEELMKLLCLIVVNDVGVEVEVVEEAIKQYLLDIDMKSSGKLARDLSGSTIDRIAWFKTTTDWMVEAFKISDKAVSAMWGAYLVFHAFSVGSELHKSEALKKYNEYFS